MSAVYIQTSMRFRQTFFQKRNQERFILFLVFNYFKGLLFHLFVPSNSDLFSIEAGLPKLINNRLVNGFVCVLSQSNKAFDFDLIIPKINRSSLQFGESEFIYKIHCTWNRIYKIASYYSKYGYSAIFWSASGLLLGHLYKFTSLPIPYDEDKTAQAIFEAKNDWDQMIYDNPFLEDANFSKPLNQWDYDLLQKARDNMKKNRFMK